MSFVETFFARLDAHAELPLVTEVHGDSLRPTHGAALRSLIAAARGSLHAAGIKPGDRVVFIAPNSARWVALDLAILAEGAIAVPLYTRQAPRELATMIRDCDPGLVIAIDQVLKDKLHEAGVPAVTRFDEVFAAEPRYAPLAPAAPADVVTLVYTSGTSGDAKGAMLTRANVDFMLPVTRDAIAAMMGSPTGERREAGRDQVFHYLPFCFAGSRIVLWTCLLRGNEIRLCTDLDDLARQMKTAAPHYLLNVPALLDRIRSRVEASLAGRGAGIRWLDARGRTAFQRRLGGQEKPWDPFLWAVAERLLYRRVREQLGPQLKCLICGSAPLTVETQQFFERLGIPVYQVYGLTETTAIATMDTPGRAVAGRVGEIIPGVTFRVADDGELLLRGPNIFPGYWGRDGATREAFEDGWFRTGDAVDVDDAGRIRVIGRTKNILVPSSGHNVAPEPIEATLVEGIVGVEQAVVIGHGRPYLTAILTGDARAEDVHAALAAINAELPHYRRIRDFVLTAERLTDANGLLTANQKLKRRAIEAHFAAEIGAMYARGAA